MNTQSLETHLQNMEYRVIGSGIVKEEFEQMDAAGVEVNDTVKEDNDETVKNKSYNLINSEKHKPMHVPAENTETNSSSAENNLPVMVINIKENCKVHMDNTRNVDKSDKRLDSSDRQSLLSTGLCNSMGNIRVPASNITEKTLFFCNLCSKCVYGMNGIMTHMRRFHNGKQLLLLNNGKQSLQLNNGKQLLQLNNYSKYSKTNIFGLVKPVMESIHTSASTNIIHRKSIITRTQGTTKISRNLQNNDSDTANIAKDPVKQVHSHAEIQYQKAGISGFTNSASSLGTICKNCCIQFKDTETLMQHLKLYTGKEELKCTYCNLTFISKCSLESHMDNFCRRTVTVNDTRLLSVANNITISKSKCDSPVLSNLNSGSNVTACMSEKINVNLDQNAHNSDKICKNCGKEFDDKRHLVDHLNMYTGTSELKCSYCSSTFIKLCGLISHMQICLKHTFGRQKSTFSVENIEPFHGSDINSSMNPMVKSHKTEFTCCECLKLFRCQKKYELHKIQLNKEKSLRCRFCGEILKSLCSYMFHESCKSRLQNMDPIHQTNHAKAVSPVFDTKPPVIHTSVIDLTKNTPACTQNFKSCEQSNFSQWPNIETTQGRSNSKNTTVSTMNIDRETLSCQSQVPSDRWTVHNKDFSTNNFVVGSQDRSPPIDTYKVIVIQPEVFNTQDIASENNGTLLNDMEIDNVVNVCKAERTEDYAIFDEMEIASDLVLSSEGFIEPELKPPEDNDVNIVTNFEVKDSINSNSMTKESGLEEIGIITGNIIQITEKSQVVKLELPPDKTEKNCIMDENTAGNDIDICTNKLLLNNQYPLCEPCDTSFLKSEPDSGDQVCHVVFLTGKHTANVSLDHSYSKKFCG